MSTAIAGTGGGTRERYTGRRCVWSVGYSMRATLESFLGEPLLSCLCSCSIAGGSMVLGARLLEGVGMGGRFGTSIPPPPPPPPPSCSPGGGCRVWHGKCAPLPRFLTHLRSCPVSFFSLVVLAVRVVVCFLMRLCWVGVATGARVPAEALSLVVWLLALDGHRRRASSARGCSTLRSGSRPARQAARREKPCRQGVRASVPVWDMRRFDAPAWRSDGWRVRGRWFRHDAALVAGHSLAKQAFFSIPRAS